MWTDRVWNPFTGCSKVSEGMGDLFHPDVPFEFIADVWRVMAAGHKHSFQVLTKRPERMAEWFKWRRQWWPAGKPYEPLSNVWLGVSAEDQTTADERIPTLLTCPAAVRFVSCEPLLGPVDLKHVQTDVVEIDALTGDHGVSRPHQGHSDRCLNWVIVGGESGPGARPMRGRWVYSLRDQCAEAGVPFHFKQWGEWMPWTNRETVRGRPVHEWPANYPVEPKQFSVRVGKAEAGRLLSGVVHKEFPEV